MNILVYKTTAGNLYFKETRFEEVSPNYTDYTGATPPLDTPATQIRFASDNLYSTQKIPVRPLKRLAEEALVPYEDLTLWHIVEALQTKEYGEHHALYFNNKKLYLLMKSYKGSPQTEQSLLIKGFRLRLSSDVLEAIETTPDALKDLETAFRTYIITHSEDLLKPVLDEFYSIQVERALQQLEKLKKEQDRLEALVNAAR